MSPGGKTVFSEKKGKILLVTINNPKKKNALDRAAYEEITRILNNAANDVSISVIVFTGAGDFYSSGNDLSASVSIDNDDIDEILRKNFDILKDMVQAFCQSPKILIALVNGPCIGIGATSAALCDVIYCSETAYFYTPFTALGLVPEGGSTYLFPRILGKSKASEMILLNHKMYPEEALRFNFISEIYKPSEVGKKIWPKIKAFSELPPESLKASKKLVRDLQLDVLTKAISAEGKALMERYKSSELFEAMAKFMSRKSKL